MSEPFRTFVALLLAGERLMEEVDDYVDAWHADPGGLELHEVLGFEPDEYALWMTNPEILPWIVLARQRRQPLRDVLQSVEDQIPLAARVDRPLQAKRLHEWLKRTGRID